MNPQKISAGRMKFLITNSVPLNGGDEALLRAVVESLQARWPRSEITVLVSDPGRGRAQCPDLHFAPDLDVAAKFAWAPLQKILRFTQRFKKTILLRFAHQAAEWLAEKEGQRRPLKFYRESTVVLSAPGGFFHDFYPIEGRLRGLEAALRFGKPVILFAQSLGPFWKKKSKKRISEVLNRVSRICIRESLSREHLLKCGVAAGQIEETGDAAFLWHTLAPELFTMKTGPVRTIGMCFRGWPLGDDSSARTIVAKGTRLCEEILATENRRLLFLSTCQGIPNYVDDSILALEIVGGLSAGLRERCVVDRKRYAPRELIPALGQADAFIGMRLHACLLAMLGGTPAMGLGYEDKTPGIFKQLGLEAYQLGFEEEASAWIDRTRIFLNDLEAIRSALPGALAYACAKARKNIDIVAGFIEQP